MISPPTTHPTSTPVTVSAGQERARQNGHDPQNHAQTTPNLLVSPGQPTPDRVNRRSHSHFRRQSAGWSALSALFLMLPNSLLDPSKVVENSQTKADHPDHLYNPADCNDLRGVEG